MSERLNDYFAREAAEYLDQLEGLLGLPGVPDADGLLRLATGVRGSSQMARADGVALEAEKLEDAARSLLSGELGWTDELRSTVMLAVKDLKALVGGIVGAGPASTGSVAGLPLLNDPATGDEPSRSHPAGAVPIDSLFFDDAGPHIVERTPAKVPTGAAALAVPIEELLLRGDDALREALALRPTLESFARGDAVRGRALDDLVSELFDLVEQGIATGSRPA